MKKLFLMIAALVATVAFVACSGASAPKPTGDTEKDVKAITEYIKSHVESINSKDEYVEWLKELNGVTEEFETYYKENPDLDRAWSKAKGEMLGVLLSTISKGQELGMTMKEIKSIGEEE